MALSPETKYEIDNCGEEKMTGNLAEGFGGC
jgi:hypothetical protein